MRLPITYDATGTRAFSSVMTLLGLFLAVAQGGHCAPAKPNLAPREWEPLPAWAQENGFKLTRSKRDEAIVLTNQADILSFKVESLSARIKGVNVWLCNPILLRDGQPCISLLDLRETIRPILFPGTRRTQISVKTICLDPGHGGKDIGGVSGGYVEKQYTLLLAKELARQLKAVGFNVLLTRRKDKSVELEERPTVANQHKADLFISLHFNVAPQGEASGIEVYCLTPAATSSTNTRGEAANMAPVPGNRQDPQNVLLAYQLQKSLVGKLCAEDRGLRRARFAVLRTATMPAVLIEGGFLSDSVEQKKIADPKYRTRLAEAIVQGVLAFKHAVQS